jgi:SulP family sulfate permease
MRFISIAVMTGFISGLGVLTILGQVGDLTGYYSEANNKVIRAIDTILNLQQIDLATLVVGLSTIAIIIIVNRTRFEKLSLLVGVLLTTVLVAVLNPSTVAVVGDTTEIPRSLPNFNLPDPSLILAMLAPALTIAVIALVQAAGVSSNIPNPDGKFPNPSGDFKGQGAGNLAVGLVGGVPVGGSVSGTIMIQNMGGKSRWANLFTGISAAGAMLLIAPFIERIPMATLAGLLITVGYSMVNEYRIRMVWNTGMGSALIMIVSFVATLFIPLQAAVGLGVLLHILLFVFKSANLMRIERIEIQSDGTFVESEVPTEVTSNEIVMLEPTGSLSFAAAAEFDSDLPDVGDAHHAVVIIRLRYQDEVSSTFLVSIERYTRMLHDQDNLLILSGLKPHVVEQLEDTGLIDLVGPDNIFPAQPQFGVAAKQALARAADWQAKQKE